MPRKRHHFTAAEIVGNLPLHQQLDALQAKLVKLSPIWRSWAQQAVDEKRLSADCYHNTQLSVLRGGKLVLVCNNAVNASQIKHQQQSLLESLQIPGFSEIEQIIVRIQHPSGNQFDQLPNRYGEAYASASIVRPTFIEPSSSSLKTIENFQKIVKSDRLANSLRRLATTLRNIKD